MSRKCTQTLVITFCTSLDEARVLIVMPSVIHITDRYFTLVYLKQVPLVSTKAVGQPTPDNLCWGRLHNDENNEDDMCMTLGCPAFQLQKSILLCVHNIRRMQSQPHQTSWEWMEFDWALPTDCCNVKPTFTHLLFKMMTPKIILAIRDP